MKRVLVLLTALLCFCLLPPSARAASFDIAEYTMDIWIETDGAARVEETIVYSFQGSHNGFLATIRHDAGASPQDLRLYADGTRLTRVDAISDTPMTYTLDGSREETDLKTYTPGGKGIRTFRMEYRLDGFAQKYRDTARIHRTLLFGQARYGEATFRIILPDGAAEADILAFVHGALPREALTVQGGTLTLGPGLLRDGDRVEVDILFPGEWLPHARMMQTDIRADVLAMEAALAREKADAEAARAQRARTVAAVILGALAVYAVAGLLTVLRLRKKYGFKRRILPTTDDALLDDLPPAIAREVKFGSTGAAGLAGALMGLADIGVLKMETEPEDAVFTLLQRKDGLEKHEYMLLDWLFDMGAQLRISALDAGEDAAAAAAFNTRYNEWKRQVTQDTVDRGLTNRAGGDRGIAALVFTVLGLALGFFLVRNGLWPLGIPGIVIAVLILLGLHRIRRLTDAGETVLAALDGFIDNYRDRLGMDPWSVLHRLPLVMALGYMEPLADWIDANPQADLGADSCAHNGAPLLWAAPGWHRSLLHLHKTVNEAQSHNAGTQHEGGASSSGGGFSGGGGGSSHGAW